MKKKTKVAFLDRDGVINSSKINKGYIGDIKDFKWIKGAKKTIKYLKLNKYKIIIVTNQSGIARGYFSIRDVYRVHRYLKSELKKIGTYVVFKVSGSDTLVSGSKYFKIELIKIFNSINKHF